MGLDRRGVAVRTGHHCCQPVMDRFGISATTRISLALYNTREDVDTAVAALKEVRDEAIKKASALSAPAELRFPSASAASPEAAAEQIADLFEELGDRDARNQYLLEIGEKLPPMPAALKTEATRVHGCMSTVHLWGQKHAGSTDALDFVADSDAHIVRGLIGLLQKLFAGQRAPAILAFDVEKFFNRIGLEQFITVQRRNGLAGMVKKIRALAAQIAS
jgi:cysteine desulfurase/selenocysteine lyase